MIKKSYSTKLYNIILKYLTDNCQRAMTAADVYEHIHTLKETANKTTVYRNLDRLVSEGKLLRYVTDDGKMASFVISGQGSCCMEHLHLQCTDCGRVIHLDCDYMEELERHISEEHGFDLRCGSSILYGKCRDCAEKTDKDRGQST